MGIAGKRKTADEISAGCVGKERGLRDKREGERKGEKGKWASRESE